MSEIRWYCGSYRDGLPVRIDAPWKYQSGSFIPAKLGGKCRPFSSYYRVRIVFVLFWKNDDGAVGSEERENVPLPDDSRDDDTVSWQRLIAAQMSKYVPSFGAGRLLPCPATQRGRTRTGRTRLAFLKFPDTRYHFENERTNGACTKRPETTFCVGAIQSFEG